MMDDIIQSPAGTTTLPAAVPPSSAPPPLAPSIAPSSTPGDSTINTGPIQRHPKFYKEGGANGKVIFRLGTFLFRIDQALLEVQSGLFRSMFSLPAASSSSTPDFEPPKGPEPPKQVHEGSSDEHPIVLDTGLWPLRRWESFLEWMYQEIVGLPSVEDAIHLIHAAELLDIPRLQAQMMQYFRELPEDALPWSFRIRFSRRYRIGREWTGAAYAEALRTQTLWTLTPDDISNIGEVTFIRLISELGVLDRHRVKLATLAPPALHHHDCTGGPQESCDETWVRYWESQVARGLKDKSNPWSGEKVQRYVAAAKTMPFGMRFACMDDTAMSLKAEGSRSRAIVLADEEFITQAVQSFIDAEPRTETGPSVA